MGLLPQPLSFEPWWREAEVGCQVLGKLLRRMLQQKQQQRNDEDRMHLVFGCNFCAVCSYYYIQYCFAWWYLYYFLTSLFFYDSEDSSCRWLHVPRWSVYRRRSAVRSYESNEEGNDRILEIISTCRIAHSIHLFFLLFYGCS